jgi:hypothetical protein
MLNEDFGHKEKYKCRKCPHRWIILVVSFPVICGTPRGSSWLGRYDLVNLEAPKSGQEPLDGYKYLMKG